MRRRDNYIRKYGPVAGPVILRLLAIIGGRTPGDEASSVLSDPRVLGRQKPPEVRGIV